MTINHKVAYDDKVFDMGYIKDTKKQFKFACMRIIDNGAREGIVLTPKNELFRVAQSSKLAKRITNQEEIQYLMQIFNQKEQANDN